MTMGDETPVTSLVLPVLLRPILSQVKIEKLLLKKNNNFSFSKDPALL